MGKRRQTIFKKCWFDITTRGRVDAADVQYLVLVCPRGRESAAAVQYLVLVWPRGRESAGAVQ